MTTTVDLRHLDAPPRAAKPEPEFLPADPMDVQNAREAVARKRIERMAEGYRQAEVQKGRRP